jgi:glycosyltransferase involved in cell wall biosynthesis
VTHVPSISVVLSVYNGLPHLLAAVRSVLDQTLADFELIIVDDGSTDETPDVLADVQRVDPRVRVVRQENRGLTASLNTGLGLARGKYIARQDADDVSLSERFDRQVAFLDGHPSVAAVGSSADILNGRGARVGVLTAATGPEAVRDGLLTLRTTPVHGSVLMRREAVLAMGGYREDFPVGQDYDLWLRLSAAFDMDNLPEVLYQWRLERGSVYTTRRSLQLKYAGLALTFARERVVHGADSYGLLTRCDGDLNAFVAEYRLGAALHAIWGELLLRGLGNSAAVRTHLRRAVRGGHLRPWTLCLFGWTHLGLPWPGGVPLAAPGDQGHL